MNFPTARWRSLAILLIGSGAVLIGCAKINELTGTKEENPTGSTTDTTPVDTTPKVGELSGKAFYEPRIQRPGPDDPPAIPNEGIQISLAATNHTTTTDATGAYKIQDVPEGTYTVIASGNTGYDRDQKELIKIQKSQGASVPNMTLKLYDGQVEGYVTNYDHQPIAGATINFTTGVDTSVTIYPTTTNSSGYYKRQYLKNSTYSIEVSGFEFIGTNLNGYTGEVIYVDSPTLLKQDIKCYRIDQQQHWQSISYSKELRNTSSGRYSNASRFIPASTLLRAINYSSNGSLDIEIRKDSPWGTLITSKTSTSTGPSISFTQKQTAIFSAAANLLVGNVYWIVFSVSGPPADSKKFLLGGSISGDSNSTSYSNSQDLSSSASWGYSTNFWPKFQTMY